MRAAVSRGAFAARALAPRARTAGPAPMQFPALASLHTSAPRREEEKDAAVEAAPSAYGEFSLSNPLFQMPVGLIMAIPLLKTEMLILSEETQLVGVFMMFTAAAYVGAGEMVANSLDARKIAVRAQALRTASLTDARARRGPAPPPLSPLSPEAASAGWPPPPGVPGFLMSPPLETTSRRERTSPSLAVRSESW